MELGLSLGDSSKSKSFGCRANACREIKTVTATATATATVTATAAAAAKDLGLCMALGINPCGGGGGSSTSDQDRKQKQVLVHQDDGYEEDEEEEDEDGTDQEEADENSIVQLDLLPRAPVPRRTPWSSDNGSSEGGSSGNKGLDVNRRPATAMTTVTALATEEATSSFRMDMGMYRRSGGKRDLEGNDAVEAERASRASDEDENGLSRKKLRLSKEQSAYLEESFKEHNTLNPKQKQALAKQLNLRPRQVEVWFQNRRARTKLKQTEVDCEYLKRCCETLTEENRRLQKELQELRALKSSSNNPFYMQLPATTLTMCPSCERVVTSTAAAVPPPPPTPSTTTTTPNFPLSTTSNNKPRSFFPFSNPKTTPT